LLWKSETCIEGVTQQGAEKNIFEPKTQEVTAGCKKVFGEEVNTTYCSTISIGVIKSRRMKCVGYVALMVRNEVHTKFCF